MPPFPHTIKEYFKGSLHILLKMLLPQNKPGPFKNAPDSPINHINANNTGTVQYSTQV